MMFFEMPLIISHHYFSSLSQSLLYELKFCLCCHFAVNLLKKDDCDVVMFCRYAWTIASCGACETHMGWLFTATKKSLKPKSFWGIRSSQVADGTLKD
ncbi:hypothetical protein Pint_12869 [Pistacia integerrima]|uniref:Uncharacterized protein n=1 Tax=Pistacia integerrima TaxID=434235 RepID=A0ACC0Y934_9ROSI|nr:hypothetical protein Pint_12869 [Pistacia integerrima]